MHYVREKLHFIYRKLRDLLSIKQGRHEALVKYWDKMIRQIRCISII